MWERAKRGQDGAERGRWAVNGDPWLCWLGLPEVARVAWGMWAAGVGQCGDVELWEPLAGVQGG